MNEEKIRARIKKLLAMAEDKSSPKEAAIALKRARSLADKHQLSLDSITADDLVQEIYPGFTGIDGKAPPWIATLAYGACLMNDCVLMVRQQAETGDIYFVFAGHKQDVELAFWFTDYLQESLSQSWEDSTADIMFESISAQDFRDGYCATVSRRIQAICAERNKSQEKKKAKKEAADSSDGKSMIAIKQTLVTDTFGETKMKNAKIGPQVNPIALAMGQAAAENLDLQTKALE